MKLKGIKEITGKIILKSGLHIGAGDTEMRIGGTDNTVIKHPYTLEPYIPGSSLKGKIRSLLEMRSGLMTKTEGNPVSLKTLKELKPSNEPKRLEKQEEEDIAVCEKLLKIFGAGGDEDYSEAASLGPTRISFADCPLDDKWRDIASKKHIPFTEVKSENSIDRIKGTARDPRFIERVPSGTKFRFCITLKKLEQEEELEIFLLEGMKLLQMDSLGGSGSRGYGRIKFQFDDPEIEKKFENITPF